METVAYSGALLIFFLSVGLAVLIPVLIGTYVYKDAKSRNMDAVLWTLVAVLVPSFIGLIIYLVIRNNNANLNCSSCKNPVTDDYVLCPYCGLHLKGSCPSCSAPVDGGWKMCPKCGMGLPEQTDTHVVYAKPKKDKKLAGILIAAILIPIIIFSVSIVGLFAFRAYPSSMHSFFSGQLSSSDDNIHPSVSNWISDCDAAGKGVYVLKLSPETAGEFIEYKMIEPKASYFIYVYINQYKGEENFKGFMGSDEFSGKCARINYTTTSKTNFGEFLDYELSEVGYSGSKIKSLEIKIDDKVVDYKLTELE